MKTALLALDFINDIVHPEGKIANSAKHVEERNTISHANRALAYARESDWLVILVKVGFESNYHAQPKNSPMFGSANRIRALEFGSFGTDFHEALDVQSTDLILEKPRVSPFYGTPLEPALRSNRVDHLYLCGVSTSWAVQAAAREAHDRDYQVTIIADACSAPSEEEHQISIRMLSKIATIITADQLGR